MNNIDKIKTDLEHIGCYYRSKSLIGCDPSKVVYPKDFEKTYKAYSQAIEKAPPKLKNIYNGLYVEGNSQKELAIKLSITENYVQMLNKKLMEYLNSKK